MTNELRDQRRWERIAGFLQDDSVIMPIPEGGGLLIIRNDLAYHFSNHGNVVNIDVLWADTGLMIEGRRHCFPFGQPVPEIVEAITKELPLP